MIDVHVLTYEGTDPALLERALQSLEDQHCTVHVVDNKGSAVGPGRAKGFALGDHEFVSYLDCDDWMMPHTMQLVRKFMDLHRAVVTLERVEGCPVPLRGHNIVCYRREDIEPLLPKMAKADWFADILTREAIPPEQLNLVGVRSTPRPGTASSRLTSLVYEKERELWRSTTA